MAVLSPVDIRRILRSDKQNMPVDDFRLIDSWSEYKNGPSSGERKLNYLCYEIEVINPETGQTEHLYKAIKLLRIQRLPRSAKESLSFMDMQTQLLTSVCEQHYNMITVIANIIEPENLGLLFLYGVQGVAYDIDAAKEKADNDFAGLCGMLTGTYRTLHFRNLIAQEGEWLREKMFSMDYLTVVRGIPKANQGGEDAGNKGIGNRNLNPDSQGTLEEIIAGMTDYEYVIQVLSTPVYMDTLKAWQTKTQLEMTDWNGQLQGTKSLSANVSIPMMYMANASSSQGWSHAYTKADSTSLSMGESFSESFGHTVGESLSKSFGESLTKSHGLSVTNSVSQSSNVSHGSSIGNSLGWNQSTGSNQSTSFGTSQNQGSSQNLGINESFGTNQSVSNSHSVSNSNGGSESTTESTGTTETNGWSYGNSTNGTISFNDSHTHGETYTEGTQESSTAGGSYSVGASGFGVSVSGGESWSDTTGSSTSTADSNSNTNGSGIGFSAGLNNTTTHSGGTTTTTGSSNSTNWSTSISDGYSESMGSSHSIGSSQSYGINQSFGSNTSQSEGTSQSSGMSMGTNESTSDSSSSGVSSGKSVGQSQSVSVGQSTSVSQGTSVSNSNSVSKGTNTSHGTSQSNSLSNGTSGTIATGSSGSMGLAPSIGYNKSYQWLDQQVKDILELLEYQNERIKYALRGNGAFYTYVYFACSSLDALATAKALAKSTWQNEFAMVQPLQVLDLNQEEQKHLLYHFSAFSSDVTRINVGGVSEYKYCTVLLPKEFTAYTHLPRISEGGIFAEALDVPHFASPSMLKGDIYMGTIISAERYSMNNGYMTGRDYRIEESQLMHGYFSGASRSGKTVAAMRFVAELTKVRRSKTGKRLRIVCMDPKRDWRALARFVEPERFRFFSMGNPNFHPLHFNPCKIPKGVIPQTWVDVMIEIYCRAYGLLERGKQLMAQTFYSLYQEAGVFDAYGQEGWEEKVPELSKKVTFAKAYERMNYYKLSMEDGTSKMGRGGNDTKDAYARLLERLSAFARPYSIERRLFGEEDGYGIDDIIGADDVTVLESKGLETTFKNFIFGVITAGFYRYAISQEGGYLADDQYETVLVIEEANEVLTGSDTAGSGDSNMGLSGQSEFEQILDQSAGWGLFIFAITQKIADMPKSVVANAGLVFSGRIKTEDDINVIVKSIAKDPRFDDRDVAKWFPRSPTGWFVCQTSRATSFLDAEPILVKIAMLPISTPTDLELDEILARRDMYSLI